MKRNLQGKNIVVTGAARGIGENVARLAAARGAHVGMIGLEPEKLASLAADLGPGTVWREADVRDGDALRRAVDEVADTLGGIDSILVNAGVLGYGTVRRTEDATFARVMDINVGGAFHTLKAATPHLERSRGHVLVVASAISFTPLAGLASYAASKAAVEMLTLAYRQEVAHLGISVGLVHPGWTDTDLMRSVDEDLPSFKKLRNRLPYPGNVMTDVDDVANAIVDGLARRRKRIYVPRAVGISNWTKGLVNSAGAWPLLKRTTSALVPSLENEVERLGRQEQKVPRSTGR